MAAGRLCGGVLLISWALLLLASLSPSSTTPASRLPRALQLSQTAQWPKFMGNNLNAGWSGSFPRPITVTQPFLQTTARAREAFKSSPVITSEGAVILGSLDTFVYAYSQRVTTTTSTGQPASPVLWSFKTGNYVTATAAIAADGSIVVGSWDANMYALMPNAAGTAVTVKWTFKAAGAIESSAAIDSANNAFFGSNDNCVYSVTGAGQQRFRVVTQGRVTASPALTSDESRIYVGSVDQWMYAIGTSTGNVIWRFQTQGQIVGSVAINPTAQNAAPIYFASMDGFVYSLKFDGTLAWRSLTTSGNWIWSTPAIDTTGNLYIGANDGKIYALSTASGSQVWSQNVGSGPFESSGVLGSNGVFVIGSSDNNLYAVNTADGSVLWTYASQNPINQAAAITSTGSIVFASEDAAVYTLTNSPPSAMPTLAPTAVPSPMPTALPTAAPSPLPTAFPTTARPSALPSQSPTASPTRVPTPLPTVLPTSHSPTPVPTTLPTAVPTTLPTTEPTTLPTVEPTASPTTVPTPSPSSLPSRLPTPSPSSLPSRLPTPRPTISPTAQTAAPVITFPPTAIPTSDPSALPTVEPTAEPTTLPTPLPSTLPTTPPSALPTRIPTPSPSSRPTLSPTPSPTMRPTPEPSANPTTPPSFNPTMPTPEPTPTPEPSEAPSLPPSAQPSLRPTAEPTLNPSAQPTPSPTLNPSAQPTPSPTPRPTTPQPTYRVGQILVNTAGASAQQSGSCPPGTNPRDNPSLWQMKTQDVTFRGLYGPNPNWFLRVEYYLTGLAFRTPPPLNQTIPLQRLGTQYIDTAFKNVMIQGTPQDQFLNADAPGGEYVQPPTCGCPASVLVQGQCNTNFQLALPSVATMNFQIPQNSTLINPADGGSITLYSRTRGWCNSFCPYNGFADLYVKYTLRASLPLNLVPTFSPTQSAFPTSARPIISPTGQPSGQPSRRPTGQPSREPTGQPTRQPTSQPSRQPTRQPTSQPSRQPSEQPTGQPTGKPNRPTRNPTPLPGWPTAVPTPEPTFTPLPTTRPGAPSPMPTVRPTPLPGAPTFVPTFAPSMPTPEPSPRPSRRPSPRPTAEPTVRVTTLSPTPRPSRRPTSARPTLLPTSPTVSPSVPAPTPSLIFHQVTYFRVQQTLELGLSWTRANVMTAQGAAVLSQAIMSILQFPVGKVGISPRGVRVVMDTNQRRRLLADEEEEEEEEKEEEGRERASSLLPHPPTPRTLQQKKARSRPPSTSPPTPTILSLPVSSFTFSFTLTGGPSLLPSMFSSPTSDSATTVASVIDFVTPVPALQSANITLVTAGAASPTGSCASSSSCSVTLTYQVLFFYTTVNNGLAATPAAAYTLIKGYLSQAFSSNCASSNPTNSAQTCFVPALTGPNGAKRGPLKRVTSATLAMSSFPAAVTNTLPSDASAAPTPSNQSPTPEPTPTPEPSVFQPRPTIFPTTTNALTAQSMIISYVVHYNWGLAGCQPDPRFCVGSGCTTTGAQACYSRITQLIATAITNGQLVRQINLFANQQRPPMQALLSVTSAADLSFPACIVKGASSGMQTDLGTALCDDKYTFAPTAAPTPVPTIMPSTLRPSVAVGLASLAQQQGLTAATLPLIGGVVGAAVVVLIGLAVYMRYRSLRGADKDVEEVEEYDPHSHPQEEYSSHSNNESDFRERESGGVDVLFNPAHQYYNNHGGGGGGGGGDGGSVAGSGMYPPSLPSALNRRITLTRPAQQHAASFSPQAQAQAQAQSQSQALPAARRITIIAKPPLGNRGGLEASLDASPPSPGSLRPIGRFGGVTASPAERMSYHDNL